jgi:23S rRNA pseudouridine1911/1915/1917 synthase
MSTMRWKLEHILKKTGGSILLEDDALLAVNKPSGFLVLPDRYDRELLNLYELLKETVGDIFVVHRIDRETSGVVLFARTPEVHAQINTAFEQRQVEKVYRAIVVGTPHHDTGHMDLPIAENDHGVRKMRVDTRNGKEAYTEYKVIERFDGYALVEAYPRTGRTHQIRIHLSAAGLPILADPLYHDGRGFYLSGIKRNYRGRETEQPLLTRTALHACSLSVLHPVRKEMVLIEAPLHKDMETVLKILRKYRKL